MAETAQRFPSSHASARIPIPNKISAVEAIKMIAKTGYHPQRMLTRVDMVTVCRAACKTEGVSWDE